MRVQTIGGGGCVSRAFAPTDVLQMISAMRHMWLRGAPSVAMQDRSYLPIVLHHFASFCTRMAVFPIFSPESHSKFLCFIGGPSEKILILSKSDHEH